MGFEQAVHELYGLPPEEFTAAREAAAKAAPDRAARDELCALRRPTFPAWLVNLLVRREPPLLDQLLALGPALAAAQSGGRAEELRALGQQRRQLVAAVTERVVELGGRVITAAVRADVEATLEAALADPASAEAVRSGRLVRALSFAGFGGTDLDGAVAAPVPAPSRSPKAAGGTRAGRAAGAASESRVDAQAKADADAARAQAVNEAESTAHAAAGRLDDAVRAGESARQAQSRTADVHREAESDVEDAKAAREARRGARREARDADTEAERAVEAVRVAQAEETAARSALDALRRGPA